MMFAMEKLHALVEGPRMFPVLERWCHRSLREEGIVPIDIRCLAKYFCNDEEGYRLAQLEASFMAGETAGF
jgi:hypothetical protein